MSQENVEVAEAFYSALAREDDHRLLDLLDAAIEYVNPDGAIEPGVRKGIEDCTRYVPARSQFGPSRISRIRAVGLRDTGRAMSGENVEIVRGIYEAVARRDTETPFEVYADDIVWDVFMDSVSYHGHEGVRQFWEEALSVSGAVDLDVEELIDAGDQVLALIREREVGRTSGAPVEASHAWVWTLADGKVVRMQIFDDREQALKAVGLAR